LLYSGSVSCVLSQAGPRSSGRSAAVAIFMPLQSSLPDDDG
jgi:hypothetical protein